MFVISGIILPKAFGLCSVAMTGILKTLAIFNDRTIASWIDSWQQRYGINFYWISQRSSNALHLFNRETCIVQLIYLIWIQSIKTISQFQSYPQEFMDPKIFYCDGLIKFPYLLVAINNRIIKIIKSIVNMKGSQILILLSLCLLTQSVQIDQNTNLVKDVDVKGLLKLKSIVRTIDGSENNLKHSNWGKSYTNIARKAPARYEDGISQPVQNLPNARFLSESVSKLDGNIVIQNEFNLTMLFGTWGQFLDHDITLSNEGSTEQVTITVPRCDEYYDKECTGKETITYFRSEYDAKQALRTNINQLTTWIDASMIYGSTMDVHNKLRTFKAGKLKTSTGDLLPIDEHGQFYAGDVRATENMGLTTLQILFLREHNRLCDLIIEANNTLSDQNIFNIARNYVIGLIQKISLDDYLPSLFGKTHFNRYIGGFKAYNESADPTITTEFSSTAYRIGHPYIPHTYKAVDNNNRTVQKINLLDLLVCNPNTLNYFRVNTILKGLAFTLAKQRTLDYVDELRNIPPAVMGRNFDLFAINTDRNRDHGVSDYNSLRVAFGLERIDNFQDIFDDELDRFIIQKSFNSVDNIDTYVGVLGEIKLKQSMFGELGATIAGEQFKSIRDGDRFWYEYAYPSEVVAEIKKTTISDIILRNTEIKNMPVNGFVCNDCTVN